MGAGCMVASWERVTSASLPHRTVRLHALLRARTRNRSQSGAVPQGIRVEHGDVPAARLDDPRLAERVQRLADRLARGAGPGGELVLRQGQVALDPAPGPPAEALAELDEPPGHAADDILRRKLRPLGVGATQPRDDEPQE